MKTANNRGWTVPLLGIALCCASGLAQAQERVLEEIVAFEPERTAPAFLMPDHQSAFTAH